VQARRSSAADRGGETPAPRPCALSAPPSAQRSASADKSANSPPAPSAPCGWPRSSSTRRPGKLRNKAILRSRGGRKQAASAQIKVRSTLGAARRSPGAWSWSPA